MEELLFEDDLLSATQSTFVIPRISTEDDMDQDISPAEREMQLRQELFDAAWTECSGHIEDILSKQRSAGLDELYTFIHTLDRESYGLVARVSNKSPLPCAVVVDSSGSRAEGIVQVLSEHEEREDIVISLSSRDGSNLKSLIKSITSKVIGSMADEEAVKKSGKKASLISADDISLLEFWYKTQYPSSPDNPNLILLFQHFESFDPILLSDTIYLLSSLAIPITLIFHVATSLDAIKSLPFSARNLLRLQTFQLDRGLETLTDLLWGLCLDRTLPLAIGGETLKSLKSAFVERERSIELVVDKLHYLYMDHYLSFPPSIAQASSEQLATIPTSNLADQIRSMPSFQTHVASSLSTRDSSQVAQIQEYMTDDNFLLSAVSEMQTKRREVEASRRQTVRVFEMLQGQWKAKRMTRDEILEAMLDGSLREKAVEKADLLKKARDDVFMDFLLAIEAELSDDPQCANVVQQLAPVKEKMQGLLDDFDSAQHGRQHLVNGNELGGTIQIPADREFTKLAANLAGALKGLFEDLGPHTDLIFHELFYTDEAIVLQHAFHPNITQNLKTSLSDPHHPDPAIQDELLQTDLVIGYALFKDAGKLINLSDWYDAFADALRRTSPSSSTSASTSTPNKGKRKRAEVEKTEKEKEAQERCFQAQFIVLVSELSRYGFLTGTKRKTEHVARVVW